MFKQIKNKKFVLFFFNISWSGLSSPMQIYHPESNAHQSALHIWVILLKPGRYCDMESEKFNILYFFLQKI